MEMMDTLLLSRIQFAANISFHILFPTITIALGWVLVFFKWRYARTGDAVWMEAYFFWVKVFALSFAMGVVSGITMSFQFGTNWPGFMESVGNIAGPLLAYEIMTAFFMEAVFLGIMLFGFSRDDLDGLELRLLGSTKVMVGIIISFGLVSVRLPYLHQQILTYAGGIDTEIRSGQHVSIRLSEESARLGEGVGTAVTVDVGLDDGSSCQGLFSGYAAFIKMSWHPRDLDSTSLRAV